MEDKKITVGGYVSLERPVYTFLDESDKGEDSYRKAYAIGIQAYREFMLDIASGGPSVAVIEILANKTGRLPNDYSNWIRVGIPNQDGELATFSENINLTIFNSDNINRLTNEGSESIAAGGDILYDRPRDTTFIYNNSLSLGIGSLNNIGEFRIFKKEGYILFGSSFSYGNVVMEYQADLNCVNDDYYIDVNIERAIVDYIHWKWNYNRKDVPLAQKQMQRAEYYNQRRLAISRMNPIRLQGINDSYRKGVKGAPKA